MSTEIIPFDYQGKAVQFNAAGWLNATEIAKRFGKRPVKWLELPSTISYMEALSRRLGFDVRKSDNKLVETSRVRGQSGTWLHPKLAVAFARWLDDDFAVWCDLHIDEVLRGRAAPVPAPKQIGFAQGVFREMQITVAELPGICADAFEGNIKIARLAGFSQQDAVNYGNTATKRQLGVAPLELAGIPQPLIAANQEIAYTPTQLGAMYKVDGRPISAKSMNRLLKQLGFQVEMKDGPLAWQPTVQGLPYAVISEEPRKNVGGTIQTLRWKLGVIAAMQKRYDELQLIAGRVVGG